MPFEIEWIRAAQTFIGASNVLKTLIVFFARYFIFFYLPLVVYAGMRKQKPALRHAVYEAAWTGLVAITAASVISRLIGRLRPFLVSTNIVSLIPPPSSVYALPSGHASVAFAVAIALAWADRRIGIIAFAMAILITSARVMAGVHYPTDILAGMMNGFIAFAVVRFVHRRLRQRRAKKETMKNI